MINTDLKTGDLVRSFDFRYGDGDGDDIEGERACYVEGLIEGIDTDGFECHRYIIRVTRRVFAGEVRDIGPGERVYPPINGLGQFFSDEQTNGVHLIATDARLATAMVSA